MMTYILDGQHISVIHCIVYSRFCYVQENKKIIFYKSQSMNNIIIEKINENRKKKVNEVSALSIIDLLFFGFS